VKAGFIEKQQVSARRGGRSKSALKTSSHADTKALSCFQLLAAHDPDPDPEGSPVSRFPGSPVRRCSGASNCALSKHRFDQRFPHAICILAAGPGAGFGLSFGTGAVRYWWTAIPLEAAPGLSVTCVIRKTWATPVELSWPRLRLNTSPLWPPTSMVPFPFELTV